tara:strand:- start:139 stop:348 length:210 start_codon:yes stop_codon:yes gene_type:complete
MKLTTNQLESLKSDFITLLIDRMDQETMINFITETLESSYHNYSEYELIELITAEFSQDEAKELLGNNS